MIYNILCAGRYDNYIQLFTMGRYRDNIVNRDKLKTNYRDIHYRPSLIVAMSKQVLYCFK